MAAQGNERAEAGAIIAMMRARSGTRILSNFAVDECRRVGEGNTHRERCKAAAPAVSELLSLARCVRMAAHQARELCGCSDWYAKLADDASERTASIVANALENMELSTSLPAMVNCVDMWAREYAVPAPAAAAAAAPAKLYRFRPTAPAPAPAAALRYSVAHPRGELVDVYRQRRIQANHGVDARAMPVPPPPQRPRPRRRRPRARHVAAVSPVAETSESEPERSPLPNAQPYSEESCSSVLD